MRSRPVAVDRRDFFRQSGAGVMGAALAHAWWPVITAADDERQPLNRFPRMVQEWFVDRARESQQRRLRIFEALRTKEDAERYVASVRSKIRQCFAPFPAERTPLNPRVTGVVERDGYRIEKLIFESRPGFLVTASLYVPTNVELPRPGVVGTCGHSNNGKAAEAYQSFSQGLAKLGLVVLIYDPIGQGERLQYVGADLQSTVGVGVREHLYAGNQQYLVGEFFGTWRAWDGIRALDYLQTREEVDPQQIGVTGNSGGGTMTTWLAGVEHRWSMAAPSCFVTSMLRNLENELPQDTEQCPPRALALGLDHEDFLAALAPKPVIILAKEKDYFDVRGNADAYERLRKLYGLLGAEENVGRFVGPTYHGYTEENRVAMYDWFNRATGGAAVDAEPPLTIEEDATLWCTPNGQVAELDSKTVQVFTREQSEQLAAARRTPAGPQFVRLVRRFLRLADEVHPANVRILRPRGPQGYPLPYAVTYFVETEPGIGSLVTRMYAERHYSRPNDGGPAVLYVSHQSADAELREEPLIRELVDAEPEAAFYACDVRGIGDSQPDTCGEDSFLTAYGSDYFYAAHSIMLDEPYPVQRVRDLLAVIGWLNSVGHEQIHLAANGWGTIPGTLAAVTSDSVQRVTLQHPLTSYADVAEADEYDWPLSSFLPSVLKVFDLPDCYAALQRKGLRVIEPRGAMSDVS